MPRRGFSIGLFGKRNTGMALVVPARRLHEFLNSKEWIEQWGKPDVEFNRSLVEPGFSPDAVAYDEEPPTTEPSTAHQGHSSWRIVGLPDLWMDTTSDLGGR
jgi:hypothetical protein